MINHVRLMRILDNKIIFYRWHTENEYDMLRIVEKFGGLNKFNNWLFKQYTELSIGSEYTVITHIYID